MTWFSSSAREPRFAFGTDWHEIGAVRVRLVGHRAGHILKAVMQVDGAC